MITPIGTPEAPVVEVPVVETPVITPVAPTPVEISVDPQAIINDDARKRALLEKLMQEEQQQ